MNFIFLSSPSCIIPHHTPHALRHLSACFLYFHAFLSASTTSRLRGRSLFQGGEDVRFQAVSNPWTVLLQAFFDSILLFFIIALGFHSFRTSTCTPLFHFRGVDLQVG